MLFNKHGKQFGCPLGSSCCCRVQVEVTGRFSEGKLSLVVSFHMEINKLILCSFLMTLKLLQKQIICFYGMKKQWRIEVQCTYKDKREGGGYVGGTCVDGRSAVQIEESIYWFLDPRSDSVKKSWLNICLLLCMCF